MKDLLSKKHCRYKIHTLLMKAAVMCSSITSVYFILILFFAITIYIASYVIVHLLMIKSFQLLIEVTADFLLRFIQGCNLQIFVNHLYPLDNAC